MMIMTATMMLIVLAKCSHSVGLCSNPRSPHQCIYSSGVSTRKTQACHHSTSSKETRTRPDRSGQVIVLFQTCPSFRNLLNLAFVDITPRKQQSSKYTTTLSWPFTLASLQLCCCWTSLLLSG